MKSSRALSALPRRPGLLLHPLRLGCWSSRTYQLSLSCKPLLLCFTLNPASSQCTSDMIDNLSRPGTSIAFGTTPQPTYIDFLFTTCAHLTIYIRRTKIKTEKGAVLEQLKTAHNSRYGYICLFLFACIHIAVYRSKTSKVTSTAVEPALQRYFFHLK